MSTKASITLAVMGGIIGTSIASVVAYSAIVEWGKSEYQRLINRELNDQLEAIVGNDRDLPRDALLKKLMAERIKVEKLEYMLGNVRLVLEGNENGK